MKVYENYLGRGITNGEIIVLFTPNEFEDFIYFLEMCKRSQDEDIKKKSKKILNKIDP